MCLVKIQTISITLLSRQQQKIRIGKIGSAEPLCYLALNGMLAENSKINISFYPASLKK